MEGFPSKINWCNCGFKEYYTGYDGYLQRNWHKKLAYWVTNSPILSQPCLLVDNNNWLAYITKFDEVAGQEVHSGIDPWVLGLSPCLVGDNCDEARKEYKR